MACADAHGQAIQHLGESGMNMLVSNPFDSNFTTILGKNLVRLALNEWPDQATKHVVEVAQFHPGGSTHSYRTYQEQHHLSRGCLYLSRLD